MKNDEETTTHRTLDALVRGEERRAAKGDELVRKRLFLALRAVETHLKGIDRIDGALLGELMWMAVHRVSHAITTSKSAIAKQTVVRDLKAAIATIEGPDTKSGPDAFDGSGVPGWWTFVPDSAAPSESHRALSDEIKKKRDRHSLDDGSKGRGI